MKKLPSVILTNLGNNWLSIYKSDFEKRFASLLAYQFRNFELKMCMDILAPRLTTTSNTQNGQEDEMEETNDDGKGGRHTRVQYPYEDGDRDGHFSLRSEKT